MAARVWRDFRTSGNDSHAYANDLLRGTIAAMMRLIGDSVPFQLAPDPSTGMRGHAARAVENPFFPKSLDNRHQVRPVPVGTETHHVSSAALWTFNAMANTGCHGHNRQNRFLSIEFEFARLFDEDRRTGSFPALVSPSGRLPDLSEIEGNSLDVRGPRSRRTGRFRTRLSSTVEHFCLVRKRPQ